MIHSGIDITMKSTSELAKDLGLMMKKWKETELHYWLYICTNGKGP